MITIREVAEHCGVSIATVSAVMRGCEKERRIGKETVSKVRASASLLGYLPNRTASSLRSLRSRVIGIEMPLGIDKVELIHAFQTYLGSRSYQAIFSYHHSLDEGRGALENLLSYKLDGMISWHYDHLLDHIDLPVVYFRPTGSPFRGDFVFMDYEQYCRCILELALSRGHRRLAYMMYSVQTYSCLSALCRPHGIRVDYYGGEGRDQPTAAEMLMDGILEEADYPSLVLCNDMQALGVYASAERHHLAIPRDLAVVGQDNLPYASYLRPSLSTFSLLSEKTAHVMVDLLLHRIEHPEEEPVQLKIPLTYQQRDSI